MIYRYQNYETAALAVAKLRAEGYYATISNDSVASLWGPGAVGGVRVVASDEPIEDADVVSLPDSPILNALMAVARWILFGLWIALSGCFAFLLVMQFMAYPVVTIVFLLLFALVLFLAIYTAAAFSPMLHSVLKESIFRARSGSSAANPFLLALVLFIVLACALFAGSVS